MGKDQYLLYHPKFKKYVAFDPDSKPIFVFNPDKAKFFTHAAASNFMQKNAFGEFKFCNIIPCGGNVRQMIADASNTSVARNDLFQKLMDTLEDKVRNYDAQMVDLYHYVGNNPRPTAPKAYKVYAKLSAIVQERSKAKAQIQAIREAMKFEYKPYQARTELYDELINL